MTTRLNVGIWPKAADLGDAAKSSAYLGYSRRAANVAGRAVGDPQKTSDTEANLNVRVAGHLGAPIGFYGLKGDEPHLLFLSPEAHGSGVAAALIADAEAMLTVPAAMTQGQR